MNYNDAIGLCIEFIEKNIKNELSPEKIANECGYSTFHFSRYIFDETKLDFEYYDERCHPTIDPVMNIYVPVLKKSM